MVGVGTAIAVPSSIYLVLGMLGLVPTDFLTLGPSSGLKTVASIAVLGCLIAAVGYWDDYERYQ